MGRKDGYDAPKAIGPVRPPRNPTSGTSKNPPPKQDTPKSETGTSDEQKSQAVQESYEKADVSRKG